MWQSKKESALLTRNKKKISDKRKRPDGVGKVLLDRELKRLKKNRIEYIKDVL